jgi:hypothetical protein
MTYVYIEKTDIAATLATWVYCGMWQLYAAQKEGLVGYINWPNDPMRSLVPLRDPAQFLRQPNMYDWYFEQPMVSPAPPRHLTWTWEYDGAQGKHQLYGQPIPVIKEFYKANLKFNAEVHRRGQRLVEKYGIDFANTLAVSWRGTDSNTDGRPRLPIEVYYPFIDDILEKRPGLRIFATAEEYGILPPLLKRYPQAFTIDEFYAAPLGHRQNPEWSVKLSGYERGMMPALLMWLLSQCPYYVKNRSSIGFVASWLSDGEIVCLAHPENSGHGFDITKAEINGELVPLTK